MLKMRSPDTIIPTVYRVGGTSLIDPNPPQVKTTGVAIATEPEPARADVAVHTERGSTFADASVHTEKGFDVSEVGVATVASGSPEPQVPTRSHSPLPVLSLPSPPSFVLEKLKDETPERETVAATAQTGEGLLAESSFISAFIKKFPQLNEEKQEEVVSSSFVCDVNVEDGQAFPAGAEFIKSWRVKNDGNVPWPESTRLTFVAGDRLPAFSGAPLSYSVGGVGIGEEVDVNAYDLKAPDVAGKYVSYWRLSDGYKPFGTSMWCEYVVSHPPPHFLYSTYFSSPSSINVVATSGPSSLGDNNSYASLHSSEVIMPEPSPARNLSISTTEHVLASSEAEAEAEADGSIPSTPSATASTHSTDYDTSESLLGGFDTASDDELWEASRAHAPVRVSPVGGNANANTAAAPAAGRVDPEYVVLYDETSGDEW